MNTRWTAILTASLLIGCVSSDGSKALKREDPTEAAAKTNIQLGIAYLQQGNYAVAREKLERSLKQNPKDPDVSNNYAIYLCKRGRVDEGVERFSAVAANKYYRTPEVALTNAGVCLRNAKRLDEAQAKFIGAIKMRPDYSEATVQLANLHIERGQVPEARKVVDSYLGAFRPKPDVLFAAVTVARAAKDKMSEEKYSRALRLEFPDSAQARALKRGS